MTDEQLDKLGKLLPLFELCAKMGGTKGLERVQPYVTTELDDLLNELDEEKDKSDGT